jgi:Na+/phosphate symporter
MVGINFVTDDKNKKIAVQIDLEKYGDLWEEFYSERIAKLVSDDLPNEEEFILGVKESMNEVEAHLRGEKKLKLAEDFLNEF